MNIEDLDQESIENLPYRPGVGLMVINQEKKIFLGKRIDTRVDGWQMPQGGIDDGEDPMEAAIRELEEETGIKSAKIISKCKDIQYYDLPLYLIPKLWNGKYRGQQQQWFAIKFFGDDSEININTEVPEFSDWRWAHKDEVLEIIVPFKKNLYMSVLEEFAHLL